MLTLTKKNFDRICKSRGSKFNVVFSLDFCDWKSASDFLLFTPKVWNFVQTIFSFNTFKQGAIITFNSKGLPKLAMKDFYPPSQNWNSQNEDLAWYAQKISVDREFRHYEIETSLSTLFKNLTSRYVIYKQFLPSQKSFCRILVMLQTSLIPDSGVTTSDSNSRSENVGKTWLLL